MENIVEFEMSLTHPNGVLRWHLTENLQLRADVRADMAERALHFFLLIGILEFN